MKQWGVITQVKETTAKVLMQRHSSCGNCNACKMGQEDRKMEIEAVNNIGAKVGQWVEIDMEGQNLLTAAFIVYIIPLLTLLIGILITNGVLSALGINKNVEIYVALIGFIFMFIAFFTIRKKENTFKNSKKFMPVITEVIENERKI